ncbi:hypothetical protein DEU56DRAFT_940519 [Suillus clintonianus]|uniref:uncharacterized protein n=1 Tax=Suillus clintonianus TaxID=1904413 RepID=UPI001B880DA5|nr:uncharacterized protein DEU56DRAFT_940519 [Suillus clintonianus]KAG2141969.1 hypothetical protein DEU56DRAFT_940519 [Suillus clintonianus]
MELDYEPLEEEEEDFGAGKSSLVSHSQTTVFVDLNKHFLQGRPANGVQSACRQPQRGYPPQLLVPSPTGLAYDVHVPHLSLGNTQQLYDMVLPAGDNHRPAVHNVFRGGHHLGYSQDERHDT